ncbi:hypothetical protein HMPREF3031_11560 [Staphylococcus sp. HMSC072B07]|uniref:hypothetical protein n=1 Tax=Staphylococcus TaxID=1279 RepID=UPI0008A589C1|nr:MULTISPECIES: hypothetical protein [Staphylococcus]ATF29436.1 hypothetical protein CO689_00335 [Staphylococcus simulans]OFO49644.1 hypothetical protein HMPREF3031_11560 [Staphylococcus sp. HMSC072B07]OFP26776.1 hypothetical protein HMPREF2997_05905 [Staphylococcus sp. HMSC057C08]OHR08976.1 hypothetical protein HMPREF2721_09605 [Staphylococcus sp. HMSC078A12]
MVKSFWKALLESIIVMIGISVVLWLLNKIEVDARGIDNVISESQYSSFAFVNIFDLEVFNIAFSILIIVLIIYIFAKTALRK